MYVRRTAAIALSAVLLAGCTSGDSDTTDGAADPSASPSASDADVPAALSEQECGDLIAQVQDALVDTLDVAATYNEAQFVAALVGDELPQDLVETLNAGAEIEASYQSGGCDVSVLVDEMVAFGEGIEPVDGTGQVVLLERLFGPGEAEDESPETVLRSAAIAQEIHFVDNQSYSADLGDLVAAGLVLSEQFVVEVVRGDATSYCMQIRTPEGTVVRAELPSAEEGGPLVVDGAC